MIMRPATAEDLDALFADLRDADRKTLTGFGGLGKAREIVDALMLHFPHQFFVTNDGRPAALWIGMRKWDGVFEIYGYTGKAVEENVVGFYKACQRGIQHIHEILGAHRIEALVWGDYRRSIRWLERLGFEQEGVLRHHGPDKSDATLMGRVF